MEELKKDLMKNMGMEFSDNMSIATSSNIGEDDILVGESQSIQSIDEIAMNIESFIQ